MRYFWITVLIVLSVGCARREHIATPNPDEISTITYRVNSQQFSQQWLFTNNDLTLRYTKRNKRGVLVSNQVKKVTPNDFNWLVTGLENADYKKINSPSRWVNSSFVGGQRAISGAAEVFSVESLGGTHTFQRKGNIRLPPAIEKVAHQIPVLF
ncbi:MAG: hypothetical protein CSB47_03945 [Proteobacteria bacterium]|nr:MAG: hypothetical protein CSB47_03945 [Pseudomonadota bacterium]